MGSEKRRRTAEWDNPGWGSAEAVTVVKTTGGLVTLDEARQPEILAKLAGAKKHKHPALGEFMATSIAGNDLLSSVSSLNEFV